MKVDCTCVLCFPFLIIVYICSLVSLIWLIIVSAMYCPWLLFPLFFIVIGNLCYCTVKVCKDRLSERNRFTSEYYISTISNSILDEHQIDSIRINSQVNRIQLNQYTEPPPSYEMVVIELPSYDEAVKHENSHRISI